MNSNKDKRVRAEELLLTRLDGVIRTGDDRWRARCPAHDSKAQTLSVRVGDTGAVLVKCFAGCTVDEVCAAAGVSLSDLFPPRPASFDHKAHRQQLDARDALKCLSDETLVVLCMLRDPTAMDTERFALAHRRIADALGSIERR